MKEYKRCSNIQLVCGQAKPGANLSFLKNMVFFCKEFNEKTKNKIGIPINVEIIIHKDDSYKYKLLNIPTSYLIKKNIEEIKKNEDNSNELDKIIEKITKEAINWLNTKDINKGKKIILGTLKSFINIDKKKFLSFS